MSPMNWQDSIRTKSRSAMKLAVELWNARAEQKLLLAWDDRDWGTVEYGNCKASFHLEQPHPMEAPLVRFYQYAHSEVTLARLRSVYQCLQSVCELGVVPMMKPHPSKDCIVLEGVSFSIAVTEITAGQMIDIIQRISMAVCSIELSRVAWSLR